MRNFGATSDESFDLYSEENVNRGVLGAALMTSGVTGAFMGVALASVAVGLYEVVRDEKLGPDTERMAILVTGGLFALGVPGLVFGAKQSGYA